MRILTILTTRFEISGITNSVMNYYKYMDKSDMHIDFVAPNIVPDRIKKEIQKNGGAVFELLMRNKNPLNYIRKLIKIMRAGNYDIVHAHGNSCTLATEMYAAKKAGVKVRISHSRNTTCKHLFLHKILRPLFNKSYTHGFACGYEAGKWLFKDRDFKIINNGNDIDKFTYKKEVRAQVRKEFKLNGKKVIGHVGLFNYQKNHDFLIDIFYELSKQSSEWILILIGDGELKKKIEGKVNKLKLQDRVIFTGQSLEVERLIQAVDMMVLPSRFEGLPNVVIEWQIACIPSLVSDNVTKEVKLTDLVEFIPLELGAKAWANKILSMEFKNREVLSNRVISDITRAGYNVKENAIDLKNIYKKLVQESNLIN